MAQCRPAINQVCEHSVDVLTNSQLSMPDFLDGMLKSHPVVPTSSTPVYSNVAFQLLGYVLEAMTSKEFPDLLEDDLINPLHLTRFSYDTPKDEYGIIPDGNSSLWKFDLGDETPYVLSPDSSLDMKPLISRANASAVLEASTPPREIWQP